VQCTFHHNTASVYGGGAAVCSAGSLTFSGCTFSDNSAPSGGGMYSESQTVLQGSILAFSLQGEGLHNTVAMNLSCCDIYANAGGDWVGDLAGQLGISGNISADPLFCGAPAGDLTLNSASPCVNSPGCGLIGAWPVGCPAAGIEAPMAEGVLVITPNPVVRSCRIRVDLPGALSARIADVTGRTVRILASGAGERAELVWDARDEAGREVPAGFYVIRVQSPARAVHRRFLVVR
jgi:hypothetical protein